jgi:hypothetical protein
MRRGDQRIVRVIVYTSSFAFHGTYFISPFVASSSEALAALLRVRWDGEASA